MLKVLKASCLIKPLESRQALSCLLICFCISGSAYAQYSKEQFARSIFVGLLNAYSHYFSCEGLNTESLSRRAEAIAANNIAEYKKLSSHLSNEELYAMARALGYENFKKSFLKKASHSQFISAMCRSSSLSNAYRRHHHFH